MAFVKVFSQGEERTVFLGDEPILFGRGDDTDVLLKDVKVSRHHCVVEPRGDGRWRIRDLGSGNGTKVNGKRVDKRVLAPEDVVQVGDAKILFSGEAVEVVSEPAGEPPPRRRARRSTGAWKPWAIVAGLLVCGAAAFFLIDGDLSRTTTASEETLAYKAVLSAAGDEELIELAGTFLGTYPGSVHAVEVEAAVAAARERLREGTPDIADGFDPTAELNDLPLLAAIKRLEEMMLQSKEEHRPAIRIALADYRERLRSTRAKFFRELETVFAAHVGEGQYARAREIWFFLSAEPDWVPIPPEYVTRIVEANRELENGASAARGRLFEEVTRAEAAHDFARAKKLLLGAMPRFDGTSVMRSLEERLDFVESAMREGVKGKPTARPTVVRIDVERKMRALLEGLKRRDFAGVASGLNALAEQSRKEPGYKELVARARECRAAAALHVALVDALSSGKAPKRQIAKRWRVVSGDAQGLTVRVKGEESTWTWTEAPAELVLALLRLSADEVEDGYLGLAVIAHAIGAPEALVPALALAYEKERGRGALDAFIAARVRNETVPEGGYVVDGGEVLSRKAWVRKREEALIKGFVAQLDKAHAAITGARFVARLDKLTKRKDQLDAARKHALELIYDEKKYFYPYRGTGRDSEYAKVQKEVDHRVGAVRELWEDRTTLSVKGSAEIQRHLRLFDEAAAELEKRLVDVEDKVAEVGFLRSYLGKRFNVRTFYRTPEERDLLAYSVEVMAFNPEVEGDITDVERRQVEVTNEYRMMFGRWPVRLIEKLVLSSRGHCQEMSKLNYFGHFSPTPGRRTPYDRMRLQGYEWGSSENCVVGTTDPKGAHDRWCHSSGHHRNLLMAPWTEMGTGAHGAYMTQNFGRAPKWSKDDPEPEPEPDIEDWFEEEDEDGETEFDYGDEDEE